MPYLLILDQNRKHAQSYQELLAVERNDFLFRFITADEPFLYYYNPESKQSSKEWKRALHHCQPNSNKTNRLVKFYIRFFGTIKE